MKLSSALNHLATIVLLSSITSTGRVNLQFRIDRQALAVANYSESCLALYNYIGKNIIQDDIDSYTLANKTDEEIITIINRFNFDDFKDYYNNCTNPNLISAFDQAIVIKELFTHSNNVISDKIKEKIRNVEQSIRDAWGETDVFSPFQTGRIKYTLKGKEKQLIFGDRHWCYIVFCDSFGSETS